MNNGLKFAQKGCIILSELLFCILMKGDKVYDFTDKQGGAFKAAQSNSGVRLPHRRKGRVRNADIPRAFDDRGKLHERKAP